MVEGVIRRLLASGHRLKMFTALTNRGAHGILSTELVSLPIRRLTFGKAGAPPHLSGSMSGNQARQPSPLRVAECVGRSAEHQQYSAENQSQTILDYAKAYGLEDLQTAFSALCYAATAELRGPSFLCRIRKRTNSVCQAHCNISSRCICGTK